MRRSLALPMASYGTALVLALFIGFPLFWMVLSSLKPSADLFVSPPRIWPASFTLEWYRNIVGSSDAPIFFRNSLIVATSTTLLCLAMGTLAAYGITRFDFPGKSAVLIGTLLSYVFPAVVLFIPIYMIIGAVGLLDTLLGVVVAHTILSFPFSLWMLRSFLDGIPREIDESAWVDGASYLRTFAVIILPLALPGIFSVAVFVFVLSWNEFLFASVLVTTSDLRTIPTGIAEFITSFDVRWGEIMAMGTLATVPVVILFMLVQRFFLRGVLSGAVKG